MGPRTCTCDDDGEELSERLRGQETGPRSRAGQEDPHHPRRGRAPRAEEGPGRRRAAVPCGRPRWTTSRWPTRSSSGGTSSGYRRRRLRRDPPRPAPPRPRPRDRGDRLPPRRRQPVGAPHRRPPGRGRRPAGSARHRGWRRRSITSRRSSRRGRLVEPGALSTASTALTGGRSRQPSVRRPVRVLAFVVRKERRWA